MHRLESFEEFWGNARRKVMKKRARKSWDVAVRDIAKRRGWSRAMAEAWLLYKWVMYNKSPKIMATALKFVPHPSSWLNGGGYDDDPKEWLDGGEQAGRQLSAADKFREENPE